MFVISFSRFLDHPLSTSMITFSWAISFAMMIVLDQHLVNDEVVCGSATSSLHPPLFPFHQVKVVVNWDLHARGEPFIDVVKTSDRSFFFLRSLLVFFFSLEKSPRLGMSHVLPLRIQADRPRWLEMALNACVVLFVSRPFPLPLEVY